MTDVEFEAVYLRTLQAIEEVVEAAIDNDDCEVDYETINDILTLEFEEGSVIIITKQGATQQLWLAATSGGFHFEYDEPKQVWQSTIDQQSLAEKLSLSCQLQGNFVNFVGTQGI